MFSQVSLFAIDDNVTDDSVTVIVIIYYFIFDVTADSVLYNVSMT